MSKIYFDHHTLAKPHSEVISSMLPYLHDKWGACSQPHDFSQKMISEIKKGYLSILGFVGATESDSFVFTSSRSEAVSHVYDHIYRQVVRETGKHHIITSNADDAPIVLGLKKLEALGCHVTYQEVGTSGSVDPQALIESITPRTALVSLTLASGMTGVIQNLKGIQEVLSTRGVLLHLDVTYALGKMEINFHDLDVDFMTFGGQVLHAPKGTGALIAKKEVNLTPFIMGGFDQNGLRGGDLDTINFIGFATACSLMKQYLSEMTLEGARLRDLFEKKLKGLEDIEVLFETEKRLPNTSVIAFKKVHSDCLLYTLNKRGISACIGGNAFQKLSHLLENMNFKSTVANTALSFSFSRENTTKEVKQAVEIICEEVKRLRVLSEKLEFDHVE